MPTRIGPADAHGMAIAGHVFVHHSWPSLPHKKYLYPLKNTRVSRKPPEPLLCWYDMELIQAEGATSWQLALHAVCKRIYRGR